MEQRVIIGLIKQGNGNKYIEIKAQVGVRWLGWFDEKRIALSPSEFETVYELLTLYKKSGLLVENE